MGGVQKGQNIDYIIFERSLIRPGLILGMKEYRGQNFMEDQKLVFSSLSVWPCKGLTN